MAALLAVASVALPLSLFRVSAQTISDDPDDPPSAESATPSASAPASGCGDIYNANPITGAQSLAEIKSLLTTLKPSRDVRLFVDPDDQSYIDIVYTDYQDPAHSRANAMALVQFVYDHFVQIGHDPSCPFQQVDISVKTSHRDPQTGQQMPDGLATWNPTNSTVLWQPF